MEREQLPRYPIKQSLKQPQITKQPLKQTQRRPAQKQVRKQRSNIVTRLESLPLEVAENLALYLSYGEIYELCQVSLKLSYICKDPRFWRDKTVADFNFPPQDFPEDINDAINRYLAVYRVNQIFTSTPAVSPNYDPSPDRYSKRDKLFVDYYDKGDIIMVGYILDRFTVAKQPMTDQLEDALNQRNTEVLKYFTKYIIKHNIILSHFRFDVQLLGGYGLIDDIFLALMERVPPSDRSYTLNRAACTGNLKLVLYLLGKGVTSDEFEFEAARNGQLALIDYLFSHDIIQPDSLEGILVNAAREGYLDLVKYAIEKGATNSDEALEEVARFLLFPKANRGESISIEEVGMYLIRQGADPNIVLNKNLRAGEPLRTFAEDYILGRIE